MKNKFIRVQIFKMTDKAPWGGNEVVRTKDFRLMKDEILEISQMGFDLGSMPSYKSSGDFGKLAFYGTDSIRTSKTTTHMTIKKNLQLYHEYVKDLVYEINK